MPKRPAELFSSILCPVDFSTQSRAALKYAALLANRDAGKLTALFVNDPMLVAAAAAAYNKETLTAEGYAELGRFVERTVGAGRKVDTAVLVGEPSKEILRIATKVRADLIVMGSEGLSGARRLFFGSTTAQVLAHTTVPVLAVPAAGSPPASGRWPGPRIMAAIDLGPRAARDVSAAVAIARWFDARLVLVHVVEKTAIPRWLSVKTTPVDRERLSQARARLERLARAAAGEGSIDVHVGVGTAADQIAALAADLQAGLAILTLRGTHRLLGGDRKGATSYRVVCEAAVPVLGVPEEYISRMLKAQ